MRPPSGTSFTKCTVAPVTFTPFASAASCTRRPEYPAPQKLGIRLGCTFRMRSGYAVMTLGPRMDKKPASTTTSMRCSRSAASSAASYSSGAA